MQHSIEINSECDLIDYLFGFNSDETLGDTEQRNTLTGCLSLTLDERIDFMCYFTGTFNINANNVITGVIDHLEFDEVLDTKSYEPQSVSKLKARLSKKQTQSIKALIIETATYYWRGDFHFHRNW